MEFEQAGWANLILALWLFISPVALWVGAGMTWEDLLNAEPAASERAVLARVRPAVSLGYRLCPQQDRSDMNAPKLVIGSGCLGPARKAGAIESTEESMSVAFVG